jgi:hypothetical protein
MRAKSSGACVRGIPVSEGYKQKEATATRFRLLAGLTLSLGRRSFVGYKGIQGGFEGTLVVG